MRRHPAGFTLIELMITIAIIGLLASIAVPQYQAMVAKARRTDYVTLFSTYHSMIVNYYRQNGQLPAGGWSFASEPPLGGFPGDISGWFDSTSPYFPGKKILTEKAPGWNLYTDDYQVEPWRSLVAFGAPTVTTSENRFMLYSSPFGNLLMFYGFHNFNHDTTVGYDWEIFLTDQSVPDGLVVDTGSYLPDE